jgi:hypothetical protein
MGSTKDTGPAMTLHEKVIEPYSRAARGATSPVW